MTNAAAHLERRFQSLEIRSNGRKLEGFAAVFNREARIGGKFTESIAPGAFSQSLKRQKDILALVDHDPAKVLGRTRSGTLQLSEDANGLVFSLDVPDTQIGRDTLALAERGDLGGMSFGFQVLDEARNGDKRQLRSVELFEISVVSAWPAYAGTTVHARSFEWIDEKAAHRERVLRMLEM